MLVSQKYSFLNNPIRPDEMRFIPHFLCECVGVVSTGHVSSCIVPLLLGGLAPSLLSYLVGVGSGHKSKGRRFIKPPTGTGEGGREGGEILN